MTSKAPLPDFYDDLDLSFDHAWTLLETGVNDGTSPLHTPTLATISAEGVAEARTVVLRGADRAAATLRIHTDRRTRKVEELTRDPSCGIHAYDSAQKIQLRLQGSASLHQDDDVATAAWAASQRHSKICYHQVEAPGVALIDPNLASNEPDLDIDAGQANFCAVLIALHQIEWVYLHHLGHRRARWSRVGPDWIGTWLAP